MNSNRLPAEAVTLPRWGLALSERRVLLLAGDSAASLAAAGLALWLWTFTSREVFSPDYLLRQRVIWLLAPPVVWLLLNSHLYDLRRAASFPHTAQALLRSAGAGFSAYVVAYFFFPRDALPRLFVLYFLVLAVALQAVWRGLYAALLTRQPFRRRALIVGTGWAADSMLRVLAEHGPEHFEIVGAVDDGSGSPAAPHAGVETLGGCGELLEIARARGVSQIILATTGEVSGQLFQALLDCQAAGLEVTSMPNLYEQITGCLPIDHIETEWMVSTFMNKVRRERWHAAARRVLDVGGALVGLGLLALQLPVIALAVWLDSGAPVFYRQTRLGRGGRLFEMYKFRTMVRGAEGDGQPAWAAPDDPRITRVGRFLRRARLDEAPQFWNILRGEMGLVGPRPERPEFYQTLERQIPFYRARLLVRPGLTGWAQVNYRYSASVSEAALKLQYDLYYIKHQSLWLDFLILIRTIGVVLAFQGT